MQATGLSDLITLPMCTGIGELLECILDHLPWSWIQMCAISSASFLSNIKKRSKEKKDGQFKDMVRQFDARAIKMYTTCIDNKMSVPEIQSVVETTILHNDSIDYSPKYPEDREIMFYLVLSEYFDQGARKEFDAGIKKLLQSIAKANNFPVWIWGFLGVRTLVGIDPFYPDEQAGWLATITFLSGITEGNIGFERSLVQDDLPDHAWASPAVVFVPAGLTILPSIDQLPPWVRIYNEIKKFIWTEHQCIP